MIHNNETRMLKFHTHYTYNTAHRNFKTTIKDLYFITEHMFHACETFGALIQSQEKDLFGLVFTITFHESWLFKIRTEIMAPMIAILPPGHELCEVKCSRLPRGQQ